jgi:hypothetical protein
MSRKAMRSLLAAVALAAGVAHGQVGPPLLGRTVQSVVEELRAAGAPFVYSNSLLPATLTVSAEPSATEPLELAREILRPHGLTVRAEAPGSSSAPKRLPRNRQVSSSKRLPRTPARRCAASVSRSKAPSRARRKARTAARSSRR